MSQKKKKKKTPTPDQRFLPAFLFFPRSSHKNFCFPYVPVWSLSFSFSFYLPSTAPDSCLIYSYLISSAFLPAVTIPTHVVNLTLYVFFFYGKAPLECIVSGSITVYANKSSWYMKLLKRPGFVVILHYLHSSFSDARVLRS